MAGLLPLLAANSGREGTSWAILPIVIPGTEPLEALLRGLYRSGQKGDRPDFPQWISEQKSRLARKPDAIRDLIDVPASTRSAILVVDQFEEVFTQCRDPAERDAFVTALVALARTTTLQFRIVLIIREDMAEQSLQLAPIQQFAQDLDARFSPPPPTRRELLEMITLPAKAVGDPTLSPCRCSDSATMSTTRPIPLSPWRPMASSCITHISPSPSRRRAASRSSPRRQSKRVRLSESEYLYSR
jgi:hypothetical protein